MLKRSEVDLVVLVTPQNMHAKLGDKNSISISQESEFRMIGNQAEGVLTCPRT